MTNEPTTIKDAPPSLSITRAAAELLTACLAAGNETSPKLIVAGADVQQLIDETLEQEPRPAVDKCADALTPAEVRDLRARTRAWQSEHLLLMADKLSKQAMVAAVKRVMERGALPGGPATAELIRILGLDAED